MPDNDPSGAAPDQKALDRMTQRYAKPGAPTSGAETARLLMERYSRKRTLMAAFAQHLQDTVGDPDKAELQKLRDAGLSDAEIDAMIKNYMDNP